MNNRKGFTLIELLIVVVIIGILAAIAIPKFATSKEKAIIVKMKGDLRNMITSQEAYIADNPAYYGGAIPSAAMTYNPSPGVSVVLVNATATGWGATSSAVGTAWTCGVFVGTGGPAGPAATEGVTTCTP